MATPLNDYAYIENKVRRVTGLTSTNRLTAVELTNYIHSFVVYDLPLIARLFYGNQTYSFQLTPEVGTYSIDTIKNSYSNFEPPVYIDNMPISYFQDLRSFEAVFAGYKFSATFATATAVIGAGPYAGTYSYTPIERGTCVISGVSVAGANLLAKDNSTGGFIDENGTVIAGAAIDYDTGIITGITFTAAPVAGTIIYISARRFVKGAPIAVLYFNNEFRFFPFPDRAYTFQINAYPNFAAYVSNAEFPELKQWADTIAFGTAMKIFQDMLDMESYQKTALFFDAAKRLALRRTMQQLSTQRVATIYDSNQIIGNQFYSYP